MREVVGADAGLFLWPSGSSIGVPRSRMSSVNMVSTRLHHVTCTVCLGSRMSGIGTSMTSFAGTVVQNLFSPSEHTPSVDLFRRYRRDSINFFLRVQMIVQQLSSKKMVSSTGDD